MPAIITHDQFGREALARGVVPGIQNEQQRQAFLLGNQGPDPLFYCVVDPRLWRYRNVGSRMHNEHTAALLAALVANIEHLPSQSRPTARAWTAGFVCHYLLDRTAHPFVYAQQYAICEAGIEGLSKRDGSEVHAVIESSLDEAELYRRTGQTVAHFHPGREILRCDEQALSAISYLVTRALNDALGCIVSPDLYAHSVHCFRTVQRHILGSPTGRKRALLGTVERLIRPHSFIEAMTARPIESSICPFDNHEHEKWTSPFTHKTSTASFDELFEQAQDEVAQALPQVLDTEFDEVAAHTLVRSLDFSGRPETC